MSFFQKITDFLTGGVGSTLVQEISKHFPPGMSEAERAQAQLAVMELEHNRQVELLKLAQEQDEEFDQRIKDLEGTASDLKSVPFIGAVILFLRGSQRPLWGFATMYMDAMWFSGIWQFNEQQSAAAHIINFLVLGFLFGERAAQNILPLLATVFKARNAQ